MDTATKSLVLRVAGRLVATAGSAKSADAGEAFNHVCRAAMLVDWVVEAERSTPGKPRSAQHDAAAEHLKDASGWLWHSTDGWLQPVTIESVKRAGEAVASALHVLAAQRVAAARPAGIEADLLGLGSVMAAWAEADADQTLFSEAITVLAWVNGPHGPAKEYTDALMEACEHMRAGNLPEARLAVARATTIARGRTRGDLLELDLFDDRAAPDLAAPPRVNGAAFPAGQPSAHAPTDPAPPPPR